MEKASGKQEACLREAVLITGTANLGRYPSNHFRVSFTPSVGTGLRWKAVRQVSAAFAVKLPVPD